MNKRQIEVEKAKLKEEAKKVKELKAIYQKAIKDIAEKIEISNGKIAVLLANWDDLSDDEKSIYQSQIYQKNFQNALRTQLDGYVNALQAGQYESIDEYMRSCYEIGYTGAMYDLAGQGIPLIMPIDEKQVVTAMYVNSKISKRLYAKLGEDVEALKKKIASTLSRGIATADSYANIARNIASDSNVGFNRAMRITRTEGHRVQAQSAMDACYKARGAGADIVKQWDATLDGRTRPSHRMVDGEIKELEEPFSNGLMYPGDPNGSAAEVINCRCALMQRGRYELDEDELEVLKERAAFFGLDKTKDFNDYKKKYLKAVDVVSVGVPKPAKAFTPAKTIREAEEYVKQFVDDKQFGAVGVSLKGIGIDAANAVNEVLTELFNDYDVGKLGGVIAPNGNTKLGKLVANAKAAYSPLRKSLMLNKQTFKSLKTVAKDVVEEKRLIADYIKNPKSFTFANKRAEAVTKASVVSGRATVPETVEDIINHEFGHTFEKAILQMDNYNLIKANMSKYAEKISGYATTEMGEYIAESFAAYRKGEKIIDPELKKAFEKLNKSKITAADSSKKDIVKIGNGSIIVTDKQFGMKAGQHAKDYGLDPSKTEDREKLRAIIDDVVTNHDEVRIGSWRGQSEECYFWIKDGDVVVSTVESKRFVTIMKGRMDHAGLEKARRTEV